MSIKQRFRPTVQILENRRLMAADAGELVAEVDQQEAALLLPAVQAARESTENDTHTYTTGGIFEVIVTVTDGDTGQAAENADAFFTDFDNRLTRDEVDSLADDPIDIIVNVHATETDTVQFGTVDTTRPQSSVR